VVRDKLNINGELITGFGPLYYSPNGHHNSKMFPWSHVFLPKRFFIYLVNRNRKDKIKCIHDLGINGLTFKRYKQLFYNAAGFKVFYFKTNVTHKIAGKFFVFFKYVPGIKEFFVFNIYCILKRIY
jgi:hypothetical protein